jgi:RNA polymerase sigma factor (sigma-70 family)
MAEDALHRLVAALTTRLSERAETSDPAGVREQLFELAYARLQILAHRMIRGFPQVRRWEDTDDVVQAAGLRLHRALGDVELRDARHLLRLTALQIRRELLDLARKYASPESFAANHETNALAAAEGRLLKTELALDDCGDTADRLETWTRFHAAIASLPPDDRELFDLVWFLGATQQDIAALRGDSPRTVRRRWEAIKQRIFTAVDGERPGT